MGGSIGVEIVAGAKKATVWGTPVALGANDGILILPTTLKKRADVDVDDSLGNYFSVDGDPGQIVADGDIPMYLRYDGCDIFLANFQGVAGAPTQQGATTAYAYIYKWLKALDGKFITFAKSMTHYVDEVPSLKVDGITIKGEIGKALQLIVNTVPINKVHDSTVNTLATFANVTYFEKANRVMFSDGVFRMNDQSGDALADGNKIYPASFELTAKRKQKGEYTGQYRTTGANPQDLIDEPTNNDTPEIRLKLQFPRHTGVTYLNALGADTRKKMDITFTGALIESTYYRKFMLQFPHLQLASDDVADEKGIIKEPIELIVHGATAAPTGMTGITDPFWISGTNRRATDPL